MSNLHTWPIAHGDISNLRSWPGDASALVGWAIWTVDSLYYLDDLDQQVMLPPVSGQHPWEVVDLAHARWAASLAIGAIDLCAAALARQAGVGPTVTRGGRVREFDLGDAQQAATEGRLTGPSADWATAVAANPDVQLLTAIRHPTTHARLRRHFLRLGPDSDRTHLIVDDAGGRIIEVGDIVDLAKQAATTVVEDFLDRVQQGMF